MRTTQKGMSFLDKEMGDKITYITAHAVSALCVGGKIRRETAIEVLRAMGATDKDINAIFSGLSKAFDELLADGRLDRGH